MTNRLFDRSSVAPGGRWNKGIIEGLPFADGIGDAPEPDGIERYVTSSFGEQGRIILPDGSVIDRRRAHTGTDIHAAKWTWLGAMAAGYAKFVGRSRFGTGAEGYHVVIDHGNGIETWYLHMVDPVAEVGGFRPTIHTGDSVSQGQLIGHADGTGAPTLGENAFIDHLHLSVRVNGQWVDPMIAIGQIMAEAAQPPVLPTVPGLDEQTFTEYFASAYYLDGAPHQGTRAIGMPEFAGFDDDDDRVEEWLIRIQRPVAERPEGGE